MDKTLENLLARISEYCARKDIAESTFGIRVVNDGKLVSRLRGGRTITLKTLARIEAELSEENKGAA